MARDRQALLDVETANVVRVYPLREVRIGDGPTYATYRFEGYASITNYPYEMYDGPPHGWNEIIQRGAFHKTLAEKPDVQLLINHGGLPLARTARGAKAGTLELREDELGLLSVADLLRADPDVQRIAPKMERGDLDEMSFAFRVVRQRWEDENGDEADPMNAPVRRVLEVNMHRGDVSIVNYGANDATAGATLRDLDFALAELRAGRDLTDEQRGVIRLWVTTVLAADSDDDVETEARSALTPDAIRAYVAAGRALPAA